MTRQVYIADNLAAIVTSANLTAGGLFRNYEYGVEIHDRRIVAEIRADLGALSELGASVDTVALQQYCEIVENAKNAYQIAKKNALRSVRVKLRRAEDALIGMRLSGGAMHTVFAKTVEYLLTKHGPMRTETLHPLIAHLHPDLCDEKVDRIINGRRYGKKWKHAVRTAQQQLKRNGRIYYDGTNWYVVSGEAWKQPAQPPR